jgi:hypothetical protein
MEDRQFDALVKSLMVSGTPRRSILRALGGGTLAALARRFITEEEAAAKKKRKKKKCKGNTRKCNGTCIPQDNCCVNGDCVPGETCIGGQCIQVNKPQCEEETDCLFGEACINGTCLARNGTCGTDDDCSDNEDCINGQCRCIFPQKLCGDACCASGEACVNEKCVVGQGTCAAGQSICDENNVTCNGNASCTCAERLDDGEPRCIQFIFDERENCTCGNDFQCEQEFGTGAICIKGGDSCECLNANLGRCALLCPDI